MKLRIVRRVIAGIPLLEVAPAEHAYHPLPTIFFYHGWQSQKELVLTQARKLATRDFRVVIPDALNHGERQQPVSKIPSLTFWQSIQANLAEFATLHAYFARQKLILADEVAVGGVSMGGMTTTMLLAQHPEVKAGACLMGSAKPAHYVDLIWARASREGVVLPHDLFELMSWVKAYDLSLQPEKLAGRPLFMWHGTDDDRIPYSEAHDFFNQIHALPAGKRTTLITGVGQKHLIKPELMTETAEFFAEAYKKSKKK